MNAEEYYTYQAKARSLHTFSDVENQAVLKARIYDRILLKWLPPNKKASIYEVACGPGMFIKWLMSHGYENISGSDSSEAQITLAQAGNLPVTLADSLKELAAMPDGSKECIVGLDFYEHLPKEVMLDFFKTAFRVLSPSGVLILRGPNGDSPVIGRSLFNDITHHWALTSVAFNALLQMFGFKRIYFADDALASLERYRFVKLPITWASQLVLKFIIRSSTRENIKCLSASFFIIAKK